MQNWEYLKKNKIFEKEQNIVETSSEPLLKALKALFYVVSEKNKELERLNNENLKGEELQ